MAETRYNWADPLLPEGKRKIAMDRRRQELMASMAVAQSSDTDLTIVLKEWTALLLFRDELMRSEFEREEIITRDNAFLSLLTAMGGFRDISMTGKALSPQEYEDFKKAMRVMYTITSSYCKNRQIGPFEPVAQAPPPPVPPPPPAANFGRKRRKRSKTSPPLLKSPIKKSSTMPADVMSVQKRLTIKGSDLTASASRLRTTKIARSPGGTPRRDQKERMKKSTHIADQLGVALRDKFRGALGTTPDNSPNQENITPANSPSAFSDCAESPQHTPLRAILRPAAGCLNCDVEDIHHPSPAPSPLKLQM